MSNDKTKLQMNFISPQNPMFFLLTAIFNTVDQKGFSYDYAQNHFKDVSGNLYSLVRVLSGSLTVYTKNGAIDLKQDDFLLLHYNDILSYTANSDLHYFWYNYYVNFTTEKFESLLGKPMPLIVLQDEIVTFNELFTLSAMQNTEKIAQSHFKFNLYYLNLLDRLTNLSEKTDYVFQEMKDISVYVSEHLSEPLSISQIAKDHGLSERTLLNYFKKYFHCSLKSYHILLRLTNACALLVNTSTSIKDIARRSGYDSQLYFSKDFKKHYKLTPSEYRNRYTPTYDSPAAKRSKKGVKPLPPPDEKALKKKEKTAQKKSRAKAKSTAK